MQEHASLSLLVQIIYLLRELWRGCSAKQGLAPNVPGGDKGLMRATSHLCLTRWDVTKPATVDNLVGEGASSLILW